MDGLHFLLAILAMLGWAGLLCYREAAREFHASLIRAQDGWGRSQETVDSLRNKIEQLRADTSAQQEGPERQRLRGN